MTVLVARPLPPRRMGEQRHHQLATAQLRLMLMMLLFAAAIALVIGRLLVLAALAEPVNAAGSLGVGAARGDIVDRNGAPLARTIDAWAIGVHPDQLLGDKHRIADLLAHALPGTSADRLYAQIASGNAFTYLQRRASSTLVTAVNAIGEPGIVFERESERLYPQTTLAAHVLGFLDTQGRGQSGIERALDDRLSNPVLNSQPVPLSIDARVQQAMESELGQALTRFNARGGAGLVLDVHTGEVVSMVSLPVFNPNRVGTAGADSFRNNTVQSVYELGSTFKPITAAAALDSGVVTDIRRRFDATAPLKVGRFTIHDERGDPKRWLNIPETLIYSSNVATARIADELGPERLQSMFRKMGFDTKPDIELREKGRPLWPHYWARTTTMTTGFGHGIAVTPLQLAAAYAALVNGGIWRPSTLLKIGPGHLAPAGRRVISEATSYRIRQMLRLIVLRGTGRKGDAPGYRVGGKTGTGEIASGGGGYDRSRNVATFAAVFPIEAPRYVVLAMLDSPQATKETFGWKTAAWNAAPVVGRVIMRVGPLLGVMPTMQRDIDESDLLPLLSQDGPNAGAQ